MALPEGAAPAEIEESPQPSRTYNLGFESKRIAGMIDGIEAVKQFIIKTLSTERFVYSIYSSNYGQEITNGLVAGIELQVERWVREALLVDDRITDIQDFLIEVSGDTGTASFTAVTIFGPTPIERRFNFG